MELRLFNSLKNQVTSIDLQPGQTINIYLCGPTVYDHIHIGNLRSVIVFDVLHRLLLKLGIKVNYVQNITDIDDKIIAKAQKEKKSEKWISKHYSKAYFDNLIRYNILFPSYSPLVTNYIPEIQNFISSLLKKNSAYQQGENIFFRTGGNEHYGRLSGQNFEKLKKVREINQLGKLDDRDFVLWKKTQEGIVWDSPWGSGRPGWHTECAVFVNKIFHSQTIDIHGGGNDLLFPHHENERIQYISYNNKELSKVWFHISHINWNKEKMSKSLGNTVLAKHFYQKYGANVLRYIIFSSHYNQLINLDQELIQQNLNYVQKIDNFLKRLNFYLYLNKIDFSKKVEKAQVYEEIVKSLLDNFNSIKVLYILEKTISFLNKGIDKEEKGEEIEKKINDFYFILDILGFKFDLPSYNLKIKLLIKKWQELSKDKRYFESDKIRTKLQKLSIF